MLESDDEDSTDDERQLSLLALLSQIMRDKSGASVIRRASKETDMKGYNACKKLTEHFQARSQYREESLHLNHREPKRAGEDFRAYSTRLQDTRLELEGISTSSLMTIR